MLTCEAVLVEFRVVVREKLLVYSGGVYEGGAGVLSSVPDAVAEGAPGVSVETPGVSVGASGVAVDASEVSVGGASEVSVGASGVSVGDADEAGTSEVESAALLEGASLGDGELEDAGVSLLDSGALDGAGVSLLGADGAGDSLLGSGVLDREGGSLLEGSGEELGALPELMEGDTMTVVGSAVETSVVGSMVTVGLSTEVTVDLGGVDAVETTVVGSACVGVTTSVGSTAENAGIVFVTVSRASREATVVTVPNVVLSEVGGAPTMGSQAPEVMGAPICSLTVGSAFRYETTVAGMEALSEML